MHFHTSRWTRTRLSLSAFKRYLMRTNTEFLSQISASTVSTSFDFRDQVKEIDGFQLKKQNMPFKSIMVD